MINPFKRKKKSIIPCIVCNKDCTGNNHHYKPKDIWIHPNCATQLMLVTFFDKLFEKNA